MNDGIQASTSLPFTLVEFSLVVIRTVKEEVRKREEGEK